MNRKRLLAFLLSFAMVISFIPINTMVVKAETQSDTITYGEVKNTINQLFDRIAKSQQSTRQLMVDNLIYYVQTDERVGELRDFIRNLSENPSDNFGQKIQNMIKDLENLGIVTTKEQVADAVMLLTIWDVDDRIALVESLDTDNPKTFFISEEEEKAFMDDMNSQFPSGDEVFTDDISIDEFSFFSFAVYYAIDGPVFIGDGNTIAFVDHSDMNYVKQQLDDALEGIVVNGKTFTTGMVDSIFDRIEERLQSLSSDKLNPLIEILMNYQLYQSTSEPVLCILPPYGHISETATAKVDVVLRSPQAFSEPVYSLQFDVDKNGGPINFVGISTENGPLSIENHAGNRDNGTYVEIVNTSNPNVVSYGLTYKGSNYMPVEDGVYEKVLATIEYAGSGTGDAYLDLKNVKFLSPDGNEITAYGVYGTAVLHVSGADSQPPEITVTGIQDNAVVSTDVTMDVLLDEAGTWEAELYEGTTLLGTYTRGFIVDRIDGETHTYRVEITATDLAGNESTKTITFTIDGELPQVNITYSPMGDSDNPVNTDVTATLQSSEDITITNNGGSNTYTFTQNGEFTFEYKDSIGNKGTAKAVVDYIDKTAPAKPQINVDPLMETKEVTVTITAEAGAKISYKIGNAPEWTVYTQPFKVNQNTMVYAKAADKAANESEVSSIEIKNIDLVAPVGTIAYSINQPTNQNVVATLTFEAGENPTITNNNGSKVYTFTKNGEFTFSFVDAAGNNGSAKAVVNWIDKTAPTAAISYSTKTLTNENVVVKLLPSEAVTITNNNGSDTYTFTENGNFLFTFKDTAGNTGSATAVVNYIDKVKPALPSIIPSTQSPAKSVTVTITGAEGITEYRVGEGQWTTYTVPFTITNNNVITARTTDAAKNVSDEASYTINNIDNAPPTITAGTIQISKNIVKTGDIVDITFEASERITGNLKVGAISINNPLTCEENNGKYIVRGSYAVAKDGNGKDINGKDIPLTITITDTAGNKTESNIGKITIDNTKPVLSIVTDTVTFGDNNFIISEILKMTLKTDGNTIKWAVDHNNESAMTSFPGGLKELILDPQYSDGNNHTLYALALDEAGNKSDIKSYTFKWDHQPPEAPVITNTQTLTNAETIAITGSTTEQNPIIIVKKLVDGVEKEKARSNKFPIDVALTEEENNFIVYVKDQAGNWSLGTVVPTIKQDRTKPIIEVKQVDDKHISIKANEDITVKTATLNGSSVDIGYTSLAADTLYDSVSMNFVEGDNTFVITGTDPAGNDGAGSVAVVYVPPVVETPIQAGTGTIQPGSAFGSEIFSVSTGSPRNPGVGLSLISPPIDYEAEIPDGQYVAMTYDVPKNLFKIFVWYFSETGQAYPFPEGEENADENGYIVYDRENGILTVCYRHFSPYAFGADTTAPEVFVNSPANGGKISESDLSNGKVMVTGTLSEAGTVTVTVNDVEFSGKTYENNEFSVGITLEDGNQTITVAATDTSGNPSETITLNVSVDTTKPTITLTPEKTLTNSDPENITVSVDEANNVTTELYKGEVLIYSTAAKDFITSVDLTEGINTIIAVSTDSFGNKATASTTITLDTTAPVGTIGYSTTEPTNGSVTATVSLNEGTITNNGGSDKYTFTENDTFTFEFTDAAGNMGSATAVVDNIDKTPPTGTISYSITDATNQNVMAVLSASEPVTITNNGGSDKYTFTENGTFTFAFTDAAGNTGTKQATVGNIDKTPPTADISYSTTDPISGDVTATVVNFSEPGVIITNNGGSDTYTFTENGEFTFTFVDAVGNEGSKTASVANIDKEGPVITLKGIENNGIYNEAKTPAFDVSDENEPVTFTNVTLTEDNTGIIGSYQIGDSIGTNGSYILEVTASDNLGNTSNGTYYFVIDSEAPTATVTYSNTNPTNQDVVATVDNFSEEGVNITNNGGSNTYTFIENGEFTFTFVDLDGNPGNVKAVVNNIDKTAPTAAITYSTTAPTNGTVVAALNPSEEVTVTNNGGSKTYTFTENGTFIFEFVDTAGNTASATATVNNIDKTAPTGTLTYDITVPTTQNVTVTLTPSETVTVTNNGGLNTYTFLENGTFTFMLLDAAGNPGTVTAAVNNIDRTAPTAAISYSTTEPTNQDVVATLNPSEEVTVVNNGGAKTHTFTENGIFTFEFIDAAGNTGTAIATVTNIDKEAPLAPEITLSTQGPARSVDVTITAAEGNVAYKVGDGSWNTYNVPVTIEENITIYGRTTDPAGNSTEASLTITNIDRIAPTANITYSTTEETTGNVVATLIPSETVTVTNNNGSVTHTFTENGTFTFEFIDLAGNTGTAAATVKNITKDTGGGGGGGGFVLPTSETQSVTQSGGKLIFKDMKGIVIGVEAGTFESKTNISVEEIESKEVAMPKETTTAKLKLAGEIYEFSAEGKTFNKPVTVTIPYTKKKVSDAKKLGVYLYDEASKTWNFIGGTVDTVNETVTVTLEHFSKYAVMEYSKTFKDIAGHWAKNDIELMASRYIANGMTEEEFAPNGAITRAQFATLLTRTLGLKLSHDPSKFEDVADQQWYAPYVMAAYKAGLVNGMGDTSFAPNTNITREQMAVMIMRAYNQLTAKDYNEIATTADVRFDDETDISSWAHHAVMIANDLGIINGMTKDSFAPKNNATRAQAIVMIKRLLDAAQK